jgi:hypothetical protein
VKVSQVPEKPWEGPPGQLKPVTASAPPACGCLPGQPCAQHDQVGQGRGPRRTRRGRT